MSRPSSAPASRRLQMEYALLLVVLLAAGGAAVWLLRLLRFNPAGSLGAWGGLFFAALGGAFVLYNTEDWLDKPLGRDESQPSATRPLRRAVGLFLVIGAGLLACLAILHLWDTPSRWQSPLGMWLLSLALLLLGSWLIDRARRLPDTKTDDTHTDGNRNAEDADFADSFFRANPPNPRHPRSISEQATRPADTDNNENQNADYADYADSIRVPFHPCIQPYLHISRLAEGALFLAILLLAVGLRLYRLDQPPLLFVDETSAANEAIAILEGRLPSPFATGWYETPNAFIYGMAALFRVAGANYYSLKLVSLLPSLATVAAIFLLAREMFGPATGLTALFLLAINRWHLTMSRWGWNETAPPLLLTLSAFFLLRGLRRRQALDFALGGLLAGLLVYTYLSSRLALATLALFALYWLLTHPAGPAAAWRRAGNGLLIFALTALVALAPLGVTYLSQPNTFWNRSAQISILGDVAEAGSYDPLWENLRDHLRLFYQQGDPMGRHNLPGEPQADPLSGLFLGVGVVYALLRWRDPRRGLLLLWLVMGLAGGFLSERLLQPNSYRSLNAVVAVVILAGEAMTRSTAIVTLPFGRGLGGRLVAGGALALLLVGAGVWETQLYFGRQLPSPDVQTSFNPTEMQVSREVLALLEEDVDIYLSPRLYHFSPLRFLVWGDIQQRTGRASLDDLPYHLLQPPMDLPVPPAQAGALFLLDPLYATLLDDFRLLYPNAEIRMEQRPDGGDSYLRVWAPAADLAALQGLTATLRRGDGSEQSLRLPPFQPGSLGVERGSVLWTGSLRVETSGLYDLIIDGQGEVAVDGAPWQGSRYLLRGLHSLTGEQKGSSPLALLWRRPDRGVEAVPDRAFFTLPPPQQGLRATYYADEGWSGPPVAEQITPFLLLAWPRNEPLPHPFSATFSGLLRVENPGFYRFRLFADDGVRLTLDGQLLGAALTPDQPNTLYAGAELASGDHPIQIDYFQRQGGSALEFYWTPPAGHEVPVPPSLLLPGR